MVVVVIVVVVVLVVTIVVVVVAPSPNVESCSRNAEWSPFALCCKGILLFLPKSKMVSLLSGMLVAKEIAS